MEIRIPLPRLDAGLVTNLAALAGLVMIAVAVGLLAGWPWALLLGGVMTFSGAVWVQRERMAPEVVRPIKRPVKAVA